MSYTQRYSGRVHVQGTKSVSYPASESGGTMSVSYSDYEDVHITIHVDTEDFDRNVGGCNLSVDALAGSVTVMNAAQCSQIGESAEKISTTIVDGFFGLIRSELSQQMTDLKNRFESLQVRLLQMGKGMGDYEAAMRGDYARISARYKDVFEELDKECYRRIFALDEASFDLSRRARSELIDAARMDQAGRAAVLSREIPGMTGAIAASRLRSRIAALVAGIGDSVRQERELVAECESIMAGRQADRRRAALCPCAIVERDGLGPEGGVERLAVLPDGLSTGGVDAGGALLHSCLDTGLAWGAMSEEERSDVGSELEKLIESSAAEGGLGERIARVASALWAADSVQGLTN